LSGTWIYGPSGCGKSRYAREQFSPHYDKPLSKWWDGYQYQANVIIDDVDVGQAQWLGYFLKRWADHYPFPAEQKGTTIQIRPENIIVTSQWSIQEVFGHDNRLVTALRRRYKVIKMTMPETDKEIGLDKHYRLCNHEPTGKSNTLSGLFKPVGIRGVISPRLLQAIQDAKGEEEEEESEEDDAFPKLSDTDEESESENGMGTHLNLETEES